MTSSASPAAAAPPADPAAAPPTDGLTIEPYDPALDPRVQINAGLFELATADDEPVALQSVYHEDQARADANKLLWMLGLAERDLATGEGELKAEIERLKMRHSLRKSRLERHIDWLTRGLEYLFRFLPAPRGKARSLSLLRGKVGHNQAHRAGIVITDMAAVIAWAKTNVPGSVTTIPEHDVLEHDVLKRAILERVEAKKLIAGTVEEREGLKVQALEQPDENGVATLVPALLFKPPVDAFYATPATEE